MIVGIVILHVPPPIPLVETAPGVFPFIKAYFSHAVFRSTVPVLTCISGFLLFKAGLDSSFLLVFKKKTTTFQKSASFTIRIGRFNSITFHYDSR